MTAPTPPVELQFWIAGQSPDSLTIGYRVLNHLPASIYLFNQLHHGLAPNGIFAVDPNLIYVELAPGEVHLQKWIPPVPENIAVEEAIIPVATLLRSGATFEEFVTLAAPVSSLNPYLPRRAAPGGLASVTYRWIDLTIGYLPVTEMGSRAPHRVRTTTGDAIWVHALASAQTVLRSAPLQTPVPVFPDQLPPLPSRRCPRCGAINVGVQLACLRCSMTLVGPPPPMPPQPQQQPQQQPPPPPPPMAAAPAGERHCVACGAVISATARFCGRCGATQ